MRGLSLLLSLTFFSCGMVFSSMAAAAVAGKVIMVSGQAIAINAAGEERALQRRSEINEQDTVITAADSRVQIRFVDNGLLALQANSRLNIAAYQLSSNTTAESNVLMELVEGGFRSLTGSIGKGTPEAYKISTPTASIGIRGTLYSLLLEGDTLTAGVWSGGISLTTQSGEQFNLGLDSPYQFGQLSSAGFTGLLEAPHNLDPAPTTSASAGNNSEDGNAEQGNNADSPTDTTPTVNNDNSHTSTAMLDATGGSFDQSTIAPLVQLSSNQLEEKLFNSQDNQPPLSKSQIEWLSDAEYDSYLKSKASAKLVDVVIGDALLSGYKFIGDDEQTIFIDKSTQATYRLTGNATAKPLINGVEWGVWDANQIKHQGYEDIVDNSNQSLAWTQVTKYDLAQLGANGLDSINFTPNQEHFFGRDSLGGELSGASGSLNVNLSNGQLIFNDIQLTYTLNEDEPTSVWYLSSSDFPFDPELVQGNFEVHLNAGEGADRQITNTQFNVFLSGTTAEGLPAGAISQHLLKGQYMDGNDLKEIWANGLLFWQNQQEYPGGG